jgi:hypothetical protein
MNNKKKEYCLISREIISFLKWIVESKPTYLKVLIQKSFANGFEDAICHNDQDESQGANQEKSQATMYAFFNFLEKSIQENQHKNKKKKIKALNTKIKENFTADDKKKLLLYKEVLRNWEPEDSLNG